jgi:hypothetical protein
MPSPFFFFLPQKLRLFICCVLFFVMARTFDIRRCTSGGTRPFL